MRPLVEKHLTDTRHGLSTHCLLQGRGQRRLSVTHHNGSSQRPPVAETRGGSRKCSGTFMILSRKGKNVGPMSGLVNRSAILFAVDTKGTRMR